MEPSPEAEPSPVASMADAAILEAIHGLQKLTAALDELSRWRRDGAQAGAGALNGAGATELLRLSSKGVERPSPQSVPAKEHRKHDGASTTPSSAPSNGRPKTWLLRDPGSFTAKLWREDEAIGRPPSLSFEAFQAPSPTVNLPSPPPLPPPTPPPALHLSPCRTPATGSSSPSSTALKTHAGSVALHLSPSSTTGYSGVSEASTPGKFVAICALLQDPLGSIRETLVPGMAHQGCPH